MMGREASESGKLFYSSINLEQRIRTDHILRKIKKHIDFNFVYKEVKEQYGSNGNVSVPPPVILKMLLLLIIYNVRSERELIDTLPERLDWLWFLGYDIDNEIPNHSVLSKARNRWGVEIFKHLFEKIVRQCVEAGLVAGKKLFMDSSLVQANAANNSVIWPEKLNKYLEKGYKILESRLEEKEGVEGKTNDTWKSKTDPDASIVRRKGRKAKLEYQVHRGVDGKAEIITSSEVTPGKVNEAHKLKDLVEQHKMNTGIKAQTVIADKKYGKHLALFLECQVASAGVHQHVNVAGFVEIVPQDGTEQGERRYMELSAEPCNLIQADGRLLLAWREAGGRHQHGDGLAVPQDFKGLPFLRDVVEELEEVLPEGR